MQWLQETLRTLCRVNNTPKNKVEYVTDGTQKQVFSRYYEFAYQVVRPWRFIPFKCIDSFGYFFIGRKCENAKSFIIHGSEVNGYDVMNDSGPQSSVLL